MGNDGTHEQHKRGDASARLVGTTNSQQIEVMQFAKTIDLGDCGRQCG